MTKTALVEKIKQWALANYEKGGSWIVETYTDEEIEEGFASLAEAKRWAKLMKDREDDCRNA